ncbi:MAG: glycosyltransferase family 2 protein [Candidatus Dormibacteria bacterium]
MEALEGKALPKSARVQIQVVLYRSARWLPQLMTGLRHLIPPAGGFSVALWDNDPLPETEAAVAAAAAGLATTYTASPQGNVGFGTAHNALAARAESEYLLLLNPDALPQYDCLEQLVAAAERDPGAALIEAAQFPVEHPKAYDPASLETDWCSAACLLVRRLAFRELGGFDQALFLYCEDVDLSWRAWLAGWRCLYVPSARCLHITESQDLAKDRSAETFHSHLGHLYLRRKYFGQEAVAEYQAALREHLAPAALAEILERFSALPQDRVDRADNSHIMLAPGEVYAQRRW